MSSPEGAVSVVRTLRLPAEDSALRFVRLVGDGTAEGTRILDTNGEPIPEAVLSMSLELSAGNCARGTFVFWRENPKPGEPDKDEFDAWVVFELPPPARAALGPVNEAVSAYRDLCAASITGVPTLPEFSQILERLARRAALEGSDGDVSREDYNELTDAFNELTDAFNELAGRANAAFAQIETYREAAQAAGFALRAIDVQGPVGLQADTDCGACPSALPGPSTGELLQIQGESPAELAERLNIESGEAAADAGHVDRVVGDLEQQRRFEQEHADAQAKRRAELAAEAEAVGPMFRGSIDDVTPEEWDEAHRRERFAAAQRKENVVAAQADVLDLSGAKVIDGRGGRISGVFQDDDPGVQPAAEGGPCNYSRTQRIQHVGGADRPEKFTPLAEPGVEVELTEDVPPVDLTGRPVGFQADE